MILDNMIGGWWAGIQTLGSFIFQTSGRSGCLLAISYHLSTATTIYQNPCQVTLHCSISFLTVSHISAAVGISSLHNLRIGHYIAYLTCKKIHILFTQLSVYTTNCFDNLYQ